MYISIYACMIQFIPKRKLLQIFRRGSRIHHSRQSQAKLHRSRHSILCAKVNHQAGNAHIAPWAGHSGSNFS
uniref:Uncharacterized protein n=1 Tax=Triticum urartu TaxID=4572 RepID=A0A8R7V4T3_TRIUA